MYNWLKTIVDNDKGLTLLEIIISIVLISIIALALFQGMHFAMNLVASSTEYVEDVYVVQSDMESDLSIVQTVTTTSSAASIASGNGADSAVPETLYFDWETGSGLTDFSSAGVVIKRDAEGGYIDQPVYVFIPVDNSDQ